MPTKNMAISAADGRQSVADRMTFTANRLPSMTDRRTFAANLIKSVKNWLTFTTDRQSSATD